MEAVMKHLFLVATVQARNIAASGDHIVVIAGMPFGVAGTTNSMRVVSL
mgnify:CR=1 FL=1